MTSPRASGPLAAALSWLGLVAACSFRSPPEWETVLQEVRTRYPDVPQVSVEELEAALAGPDAPLLLDARAREEFEQSHLAGALPAPDAESVLEAVTTLAPEREIVVYCSVGMRSSDLARTLRERGFAASNLEGGIFAWANAGHATYSGERREDRVHPYDERWGALLAPERRASP